MQDKQDRSRGSMPAKVQLNEEKFRDVVQLICHLCNEDKASLGLVKLHRALYIADMVHFLWKLDPLTGAEYRKQQFGPVTGALQPALRQLEEEGKLTATRRDYFGYLKSDFECREPPATNHISKDERRLIEDVVDFVCRHSARELSELSHNAAWESAEMGGLIPYESAYLMLPTNLQGKQAWARKEMEEIWSRRKHAS